MKNRISVLVLGILCLSIITVQAQHDPQAKEILDKVANKTKSYTSIKAKFTNTLKNDIEDFSETFKGTIYIKDKKYKLEFMDTETYFDGRVKWVYIKESDEVNITDIEELEEEEIENEILNDPIKILTIYEEDFKYMYLEEKLMDDRTVSVVDLIPESLEKNYSRIRLFIDKNKDQLYSIKYFSKDGNHYIFKINELVANLTLDDDFFVFNKDKHPEVEVIDLRE